MVGPQEEFTPSKRRDALKIVSGEASLAVRKPDSRRRKLLGGLAGVTGGTITPALGLLSPAAATRPDHAKVAVAAARTYASERRIRQAVQSLAAEQLSRLAEEGYVTDESVSTFPLEDVKSVTAYVDSTAGTYVAATAPEGEPDLKIQTKRPLPDGRTLELVVKPNRGRGRAIVFDRDGSIVRNLVSSRDGDGEAGVLLACDECSDKDYKCGIECNPYDQCSCVEYMIVMNCIDPDCVGCHTEGYDCTCGQDDYNC